MNIESTHFTILLIISGLTFLFILLLIHLMQKFRIMLSDFLFEENMSLVPKPTPLQSLPDSKSFFVIKDIHRQLYLKSFLYNVPGESHYNWTHDFRRAERLKEYLPAMSMIQDIKRNDTEERYFEIIKIY